MRREPCPQPRRVLGHRGRDFDVFQEIHEIEAPETGFLTPCESKLIRWLTPDARRLTPHDCKP